MVLLKLRTWPGIALSQWYLGELKSEDSTSFILTGACTIYEILNPKGDGITHQFITDNLVSEGEIVVPKDTVSIRREVGEDEAILTGYEKAISEFRLAKAGLLAPKGPARRMQPVGPRTEGQN